jgi:hypothetical protein
MNLKKLVEISPIIASFLVFLGFLKLDLYYRYWDINIFNYLDFSEIILSFLNDLYILIFFLVIMSLQGLLGLSAIAIIGSRQSKKVVVEPNKNDNVDQLSLDLDVERVQPFQKQINFMDRLVQQMDETYLTGVVVITIMTAISYCLFFNFTNMIWLYISIILLLQGLALVLFKLFEGANVNIPLTTISVLVIIAFALSKTYFDIKNTENEPKKMALLNNNGEKINTTNDFIFLGKTANYFFFFDNVNKESWIYPSSEVKRIEQVKSN